MNNEEQLKQEAIAKYKTGSYPQLHPDHYAFIHGYLAGAEPREKRIAELEAQIEKMKDKLKSDLIARLKENMSYSTSPSCTKGMELFIKSIEEWEIKEK